MRQAIEQDGPQSEDAGFAQRYYEHQFVRLGQLEEHGLAVSGLIGAVSVGVFTFAPNASPQVESAKAFVVAGTVVVLNLLAAMYVYRVMTGQDVDERRAKAVLLMFAKEIEAIDTRHRHRFFPRTRLRGWFQIVMHVCLIGAAFVLAYAAWRGAKAG